MAGKPIKVAFLADTSDLRSQLKAAQESFDTTADEARSAGKRIAAGLDTATTGTEELADRGAQAGGALSGLGEAVGGKFGAAMVGAGSAIQLAGDAGDLFNATLRVMTLENIKNTASTVAAKAATVASTVATKAAAAGQWLLNAALSANPIGIIVIAIIALVAGFIYAWKNSETFRRIVISAWNAIKAGGLAVFNFLKSFISGAFQFIKNAFVRYTPMGIIISNFGRIKAFVIGVWNAIKSGAVAAWNNVKNAVIGAVRALIANVTGIKARVDGALRGAASWLYRSGRAIIEGLVNGIKSLVSKPADLIRGALERARRLLPFSPAKEGPFSGAGWTYFSGRAMMRDLASGIRAGRGRAVLAANAAAARLSGALEVTPGAAAGSGGTVISVTVNAGVGDPVEIGRQVSRTLDAYLLAGGRRRS